MPEKMVKIAGLWKSKSDTNLIAAGKIDKKAVQEAGDFVRILVFKNDADWKAENPNRPDYDVVLAPDREQNRERTTAEEEEF